jgi:hypothetical protein
MFGLFQAKSQPSAADRRRAERLPMRVPASIVISKQKSLSCETVNISISGARLDLPRDRMLPNEFEVVIPARQLRRRARLVWRSADTLGVEFV